MSSPSLNSTQEKNIVENNSGVTDGCENSDVNIVVGVDCDSAKTNCVINLPSDGVDTAARSRREEERQQRRRMDNLTIGIGNVGSSYRPRARSMVERLPSDTTRRSDVESANFRRSKTIELANEWASDSELDSVDSDSLSSGTRLTPSPLLPLDDMDRDRSASLSDPFSSDVTRESGIHYSVEDADSIATGAAATASSSSFQQFSPPHIVSPGAVRRPNNQFLHVPVCTVADTSDSDGRAVSDDASDRSVDAAKGSPGVSSADLPNAGQRAAPARSPKMGKRKWSVIRKAVMTWSPFVQIYRRKYPWVQLAGHQGNFRPGDNGTILKKACERERSALACLMNDVLRPYVPAFSRQVEREGEGYLEMQDLLAEFEQPAVMDIKMGVRTYLEEELTKARTKPCYRSDLYQKMITVSPDEPTEEEHERGAIDKPRYMQFRERCSSSWSLGFRIEGIKLPNEDPRSDFKKMRFEPEVALELLGFLQGNRELWRSFLIRLKEIREHCLKSEFFYSHEIIGSSLLFVAQHSSNTCGVWIIDFGKTSQLPQGQRLKHNVPWAEGNREDGYQWGLENLIHIWSRLFDNIDTEATSAAAENDPGAAAAAVPDSNSSAATAAVDIPVSEAAADDGPGALAAAADSPDVPPETATEDDKTDAGVEGAAQR